jgi:hypothetical protein
MDFLCEIYDAKGRCIDSLRFTDPMQALKWVGDWCIDRTFLDFVHATCYHKQVPQWELEVC